MVVDTEGFRLFVGTMVTGRITADLPVSSLKWGLRLNDSGSIELALPVRAQEYQRLNLRANTAGLRQFVGISYNGIILECGPIWKRSYDAGNEILKITAAGLWSILDTVKALPWYAMAKDTSPTEVTLSVVGKTLGSIAREFVRISIETNSKNPGLPIVLPDIVPDGTNERNIPGYGLPWLGDLLRNLTGVQRGPDIRFRPEFVPDDHRFMHWVMEHGTVDNPLLAQSGPDWVWNAAAPKSTVSAISYTEDATRMAARAYQPGAGSELDMKLRFADDTTLIDTAGYPWTEIDIASKDVEDLALLQEYADAGIAGAKYPVETWTVNVRADERPTLGSYLPGHWARIIVPEDHPFILGGPVRTRILAVDGDDTNNVKLTLAPIHGRP